MIDRRVLLFLQCLFLCGFTGVLHADSILGVASAYNLVALGYGSTPGQISVSSDVGGRIAAAGEVVNAPEVGQSLVYDSFGTLASGYLEVADGGAGGHTNVQANGLI